MRKNEYRIDYHNRLTNRLDDDDERNSVSQNSLVDYAVKIANQNNAKNISHYVQVCLDNWSKHGLKTVDQVIEFKKEQSAKKYEKYLSHGRGSSKNKHRIKEKLPDWAKENYHPKYKKASLATRNRVKAKLKNLNRDMKGVIK